MASLLASLDSLEKVEIIFAFVIIINIIVISFSIMVMIVNIIVIVISIMVMIVNIIVIVISIDVIIRQYTDSLEKVTIIVVIVIIINIIVIVISIGVAIQYPDSLEKVTSKKSRKEGRKHSKREKEAKKNSEDSVMRLVDVIKFSSQLHCQGGLRDLL